MAAAIPWITTAATVIGVSGQRKAAKAGERAAEQNAEIARQNSILALEQGEFDVKQAGKLNYLRTSSIHAAYGPSGLKFEGSPEDVIENMTFEQELNIEMIRRNALLKSKGFENAAHLDHARANAAATSGLYGAAGTLLAGGARAYSQINPAPGAGTPIPVDNTLFGEE